MTQNKRHILGLFALVTLVAASAAPASASQIGGGSALSHAQTAYPPMPHVAAVHASYVRYAQSSVSASEAKAIARRTVPGSVYIDMSRKNNVYKVRVKKDGRIYDVLIDANTGRVLN